MTPDDRAGTERLVRFVEAKPFDAMRVGEIAKASVLQNQWANGGPTAARLEALVHRRLGIHESRSVVVASSATAALFAMAGVMAHRLGRPVRWIGSSFGFFSGRIGPLAGNIAFVDCREDGSLDLECVDRQPAASWDGLLVTNVFGSAPDLTLYDDYCRSRGKMLLADNAMALLGCDRSGPGAPDEIISFHHTKPWGFGEGGCAVLPEVDADLFRHLLNFGHHAPSSLAAFAANGKMSDLAAAAVIARLEAEDGWAPLYRTQWARIADIGSRSGLRLLNRPAPGAVQGFVALQAPGPIAGRLVVERDVPMAKYYPPLAETRKARDLYDRNVCVACHPGMALLPDAAIADEMERIEALAGRVTETSRA